MNNTKEIDVPRHHPDVLPSSSLASDALNTVPVPPASVVMDHNDAMPSECKTSPSLTSAEKAMDHNDAMPTECKTSPPLTSAEKNSMKSNSGQQQLQHPPPPPASFDGSKSIFDLEHEKPKPDGNEAPDSITIADTRANPSELPEIKPALHASSLSKDCDEPATPHAESSNITAEPENMKEQRNDQNLSEFTTPENNGHPNSKIPFLLDDNHDGSDSGTEDEQSAFMKELETFFKEKRMDFKPPKFYGEGLNCIKLWRAVMRLGGYDRVTSCKLWRQVGESFKPPKTCTTVSWTFRGFYEKALLEYERHKTHGGEPIIPAASNSPLHCDNQASKAGRARRDAAERAMKGWHSQRHLDNGEDKNAMSLQKHEKQLKSVDCSGSLKRKKPAYVEHAVKPVGTKASKVQLDVEVVDIGPPADWVKITVQRAKDSFEVYALVPGLLREEVRVQSDPAGRLVISGEPEHPDNPWGVTPFKKVVTLPSRIDPHHTSAVVTLHGQLYVSVPFQR